MVRAGFRGPPPPRGLRPMMPPRPPMMHYPSQDPTRMGAPQPSSAQPNESEN